MSVTFLGEMPDSPSGEFVSEDKTSTSITRKFLVKASAHNVGWMEVVNCTGIPGPWDLYAFGSEAHLLCRVTSRKAERVAENSVVWRVEVGYKTKDSEDDEFENPLLELPKISATAEDEQVPVTFAIDGDGNPVEGIKNSAGELYNPAPVKDESRFVLTIQRNEAVSSPIVSIGPELKNAINSGTFWGWPAHYARCTGLDVSREEKEIDEELGSKFYYLSVTYKFTFKQDGWDLRLLDYGSYYLDAANNKKEFKTEDGHPHVDLLNGAGRPGGPFFLPPFQIYPEYDFDSLSLPTSFVP